MNYYNCYTEGCNQQVTDAVIFTSSDNKHDFNTVNTCMGANYSFAPEEEFGHRENGTVL